MATQTLLGLLLLSESLLCQASTVQKRAALPPKTSVVQLGLTKSTLPNIFRDGGGGATINGLNVLIFSDGLYTNNGQPPYSNGSNVVNFTSNSIAVSGYQGQPITSLTDFGTQDKGPRQAIPYYYNGGENDGQTGIWPNQPITTLCNGACGVTFPQVVNRSAIRAGTNANLYNTPVQISFTGYGPIATRPVQKLFLSGEPTYGTFSSFAGIDGYLYTFAHITNTTSSNGLKMARVPQSSFSNRSQYQYWNGNAWTTKIPAYSDKSSNIFNWSQQSLNGQYYGPGTGNIFYSPVYGVNLLLFQSDAGIDNNVYLSYQSTNDITSSWSTPTSITTINGPHGGLSYSFNAYPNYDSSGKVIPISWASYTSDYSYQVSMANITFS